MSTQAAGVEEVHILWISEGMSCDGDTISITAAGQPSIEEVLLGVIPGLPKVNRHNKVLSPTLGGEEYMKPFRDAVVPLHLSSDATWDKATYDRLQAITSATN